MEVYIEVYALVMSHAQMKRITCRELAHRQAYSDSDAYGESRDNEQACLASDGRALARRVLARMAKTEKY